MNPRTASRVQVNISRGACAYIIPKKPNVIWVRLDCPILVEAMRTQDPVLVRGVAALLAHEQAHVRGADERTARAREVAVFEQLTRPLAPDERARALKWLAALASRGGARD